MSLPNQPPPVPDGTPQPTAGAAGPGAGAWPPPAPGNEPTLPQELPPSSPAAPAAAPVPAGSRAPAALEMPPQPPAPTQAKRAHWHEWVLALVLTLLVLCAAPLWFFAGWSAWLARSHQPPPIVTTLDPQGARADDVRWSPDGQYLAEQVTLVAGADVTQSSSAVVLWNVTTEQEVRRFPGLFTAAALAWSPDGAWLATSDGSRALIWAAAQVEGSGSAVAPVSTVSAPGVELGITGLAWSKDGQTLATVGEGGLTIWQASAGGSAWKQTQFFPDALCATGLCDRALSWSPDGRWLLAAPWHGPQKQRGVGAWDTETWQQQPLLDASAPLAWSPDSALLLVRSQDETTLAALQAGSWAPAWTLNPNPDLHQHYNVYPQTAGWSPDGAWLVGAADGWVDLWRAETRQSVWVWNEQHTNQSIYTVNSLAWSPDGRTLAVVTDGTAHITLYDLHNPNPPGAAPPPLA